MEKNYCDKCKIANRDWTPHVDQSDINRINDFFLPPEIRNVKEIAWILGSLLVEMRDILQEIRGPRFPKEEGSGPT